MDATASVVNKHVNEEGEVDEAKLEVVPSLIFFHRVIKRRFILQRKMSQTHLWKND